MIEKFQTIRYLLLYPSIVVSGLAWAIMLWGRWRRMHMMTDFWSSQIGLGCSTWALLSLAALGLAERQGFGASTALLITVGTFLLAAVLTIATVLLAVQMWRRNSEL